MGLKMCWISIHAVGGRKVKLSSKCVAVSLTLTLISECDAAELIGLNI